MSDVRQDRARPFVLSAAAYALAIVLPSASAWATAHFSHLSQNPGALLLLSVMLVAWFGLRKPIAVALIFSFVLHYFYLVSEDGRWGVPVGDKSRTLVFMVLATSLALFIWKLRTTQNSLELSIELAKRNEAEIRTLLAAQEEQSSALSIAQQAGKAAAWVMDTKKEQVRWISGSYEIFGMPFAELGDTKPISLVEEADRAGIWDAIEKTLKTGEPFQVEFRLRWPDGEMHCQECRGMRDPKAPHLIRGTTFDITERKRTETMLLQAEKLAAVGRISSTIAHEINNPLEAVTNLLYLSLQDGGLRGGPREYLELAQQELMRLSHVTRLTLSYARPQTMSREIDPTEVIESALFVFRARIDAKGILVERVAPAVPLCVDIFVDELQRILTNLVANAIDAVDLSGGRIRIVLERREGAALIAVEDNGSGIPNERAARIFDPFFTTKEETGTGIGLWVTKELVEKNRGSIALQNEGLGRGMSTRFELRFPLSGDELISTQVQQVSGGQLSA